jgi:hypothetical protein
MNAWFYIGCAILFAFPAFLAGIPFAQWVAWQRGWIGRASGLWLGPCKGRSNGLWFSNTMVALIYVAEWLILIGIK